MSKIIDAQPGMDSNAATVENVSRRDIASLLGGALGLFALSSCTGNVSAQDDNEALSQVTQASKGLAASIPDASTTAGATIGWADTLADLRALQGGTGDNSLGVVILKGRDAQADGGGGVFIWDNNSTNTEDGGTVFIQTTGSVTPGVTTGQAWRRVYEGALSVKWFGAKGTGLVADTAAFRSALAAIALNGTKQRIVEVPAGSYLIDSTLVLPNDVWFRGVNKVASVLVFIWSSSAADAGAGDAGTVSAWPDGILCPGGRQRISDLQIINSNTSNVDGRGIDMTAAVGGPAIVERCHFDGWSQQLVFDGYGQTVCRDCSFACKPTTTGGVGPRTDNVHIRLAAPHGRNNTTSANTNVISIENCLFHPNGGVFVWHEDGEVHRCESLCFEPVAFTQKACVKFTRAKNVSYNSCYCEGYASPETIFLIDDGNGGPGTDGGANSVAVQNLTITNCQISIPSNGPVVHLVANTVARNLSVYNNEFLGPGGASGVFKLDGLLDNQYQFGPNLYSDAPTIFVGTPSSAYGTVWHLGRLGLGTLNTAGSSLEIKENQSNSGKSIVSKRFEVEHWWLGVEGRSTQWKLATGVANAVGMPTGETVYQESFTLLSGTGSSAQFSDAAKYPLISGLSTPNDTTYVYEMEALGRASDTSVYYHRKQRLAVKHGSGVFIISGLTGYPDEFEKTDGSGWTAGMATIAVSGGQIAVTVMQHGTKAILWYVKIRIITRTNNS